jgi:hypothetical protein
MIVRCFILCFIFFTIVSCNQDCYDANAKKIMGELYKRKITLPKNLTLMNARYVAEKNTINFNNPDFDFYVLKLFSMDCDKCINSLKMAQDYINKNNSIGNRVKYIFIASGYTNVYVKEAIEKFRFEYPLYETKNYNAFYTDNDLPAGNEGTYGTMLIDSNDELILFGSVYDNEKAQKLYSAIFNCKK